MKPLHEQFEPNYQQANLHDVRRARRRELYKYYEFFADFHKQMNPEELDQSLSRGAAQRMQAIEREFDRRSQFWATVCGLVTAVAVAASAAVAIAEYFAR